MPDSNAAAWKAERDADGIAWLTIDKPGTSANVLSSGVLAELDAPARAARKPSLPRGSGAALGQDERLRRRRRHQRIHHPQRRGERLSAHPRAASRCSIASRHCPARPWPPSMVSRWAAGWSWRWPAATASASAMSGCRSACRRCSSAFIRASAARCAACACRGAPGHEADADRPPLRAEQARAGLVDRLVPEARAAQRCARAWCSIRPPPRRAPLVGAAAQQRAGCARSCAGMLTVRSQRAPARALPGPLRHHRPVGALRRARRGRLRGRGALDRAPLHHRDLAQPDPRVPAAGPRSRAPAARAPRTSSTCT